jgi:FkbM family methyltransferase
MKTRATLTKLRTKAIAVAIPTLFRLDDHNWKLVRLGSDYGGWWVPTDVFKRDSVCYSGGVGTDISFDISLIQTYGSSVFGFDPTPKSIQWISRQQSLDPRFEFLPLGLGGRSGSHKFYAPSNPDHVSHSMKNIQRTKSFFEARVETISSLMQELGHDRLDLLKLDIEGAEHDTIGRMLEDGIHPTVICVEYDQPEPLSWARGTTAKLKRAGYELVKIDVFNFTFVHRSAARKLETR